MAIFGRISIIFGQECTPAWIVGGSILLFSRDIVRRRGVVEGECSLTCTPWRFLKLFLR
jgi:hypothetical protein